MQIHLSLMNNQPQSSDNIIGFIMETKSHVYTLVFFWYWLLLCLSLIEISFALHKLDRRSPSFIFDLLLSEGNFNFFFFQSFFFLLSHSLPQNFLICPKSMCFLLALSQSLDFCSKPSPLSINPISVFKISLICPQCGVWS